MKTLLLAVFLLGFFGYTEPKYKSMATCFFCGSEEECLTPEPKPCDKDKEEDRSCFTRLINGKIVAKSCMVRTTGMGCAKAADDGTNCYCNDNDNCNGPEHGVAEIPQPEGQGDEPVEINGKSMPEAGAGDASPEPNGSVFLYPNTFAIIPLVIAFAYSMHRIF